LIAEEQHYSIMLSGQIHNNDSLRYRHRFYLCYFNFVFCTQHSKQVI